MQSLVSNLLWGMSYQCSVTLLAKLIIALSMLDL